MDIKKTFEYFDIDDIQVGDIESLSFYPIIETNEEGEDVVAAATGFYIKTMPKNLVKILLPSGTKLKDKTKPKEVKIIVDPNEHINIYAGELNILREKAVDTIAVRFNITKGVIKEIFSKGAEWGLGVKFPDKKIKEFKKDKKGFI